MTREELLSEVIYPALAEILESDVEKDEAERVYSPLGKLDSIGLVSLVALIEDSIEKIAGKSISLVTDRAFSPTSSPFKDIKSLADFIMELLA